MLFIHIGMPKTGTTVLQRILANKEELLLTNNTIYPKFWRDNENIAHHKIGEVLQANDQNTILEILNFLRKHRDKNIIFSTESLSNLLTHKFYPYFYNFLFACSKIMPVKVVCTLRRIDSFVESMCLHDSKIFGWQYLQGYGDQNRENVVIEQYIKRRFNWIDAFLSKLHQLDLSTEVCSLITIPLENNIVRTILKQIDIENIIDINADLPRENAHLGFKAQCFFAHFDKFSKQLGIKTISKKLLIRKFESNQFRFNDEIYDYHIFHHHQRLSLHKFALHKSLRYNLHLYYKSFYDNEIRQQTSKNIMDTDVITNCDLADLSAYIDEL